MKKRIISIILVLTVLLSFIAVRAESNTEDLEYTKALEMMSYIGLVEKDSFAPEEKVTRADFADMVYSVLKLEAPEMAIYFSDVTQSHWAFNSINALVEAGCVDGYGNRLFQPDKNIHAYEALKIMLSATGFSVYAEAYNMGINGYYKVAERLEVIPKIENITEINMKEAIQIIYNCMAVGTYTLSSVSGGSYELVLDDEQPLLRQKYNLMHGTGRLNAGYGYSRYGAYCEKDEVVIDDEKYTISAEIKPEPYFVKEVEFWYDISNPDTNKIVYIGLTKKAANKSELTIAGDTVTAFDSNTYTITYEINDSKKTKTKDIPKNVEVIYNGSRYSGSLNTVIDKFISGDERGSIRLLDIADSNDYDVLIIESYREYVITQYDSNTKTIYSDKQKEIIRLDNYDAVKIRNKDGVEVNIDKVYPNLVSIAENADKSFIDIKICRDITDGAVESINGGDHVIVIGGAEYKYSNTFAADIGKISLGGSYNFYVDYFGYICYADTASSGSYAVGFLTSARAYEDENGYGISFKVFTPEGAMKTYPLADRVVIDGTSYKPAQSGKNTLLNVPGFNDSVESNYGKIEIERQIILYKLNADEEIKAMITYTDEANLPINESKSTELIRIEDGKQLRKYIHGFGRIGLKTIPANDAVKFVVPATNAYGEVVDVKGNVVNDDESLYATTTYFMSDKNYYVQSYKLDRDNVLADVVVAIRNEPYEYLDLVMVDKISEIYDETEGEVKTQLTAYVLGAKQTFTVAENVDVSNIHRGDIIKIEHNVEMRTKISAITKMVDSADGLFLSFSENKDSARNDSNNVWYSGTLDENGGGQNSRYQICRAYPRVINNGAVGLSYYKDRNINEVVKISGTNVVLYNTDDDTITTIVPEEVLTMSTVGNSCDVLYVCSQYGVFRQVFAYR